jgi:hypothetical protein
MDKESAAVKKEMRKEEDENKDEEPHMRKAEKKWLVNKERLTSRPEEEQRPRKKHGRAKLI